MIERGRGVVINLLSTAAWGGGSNTAFAYGSAKGALHTLTQALARDLASRGVRVLAVAPGTINTAFQREPGNVEIWQKWVGNIPVGRIGRPDEIGEVVAFLATDAASFIVGETIHLNGGRFMLGTRPAPSQSPMLRRISVGRCAPHSSAQARGSPRHLTAAARARSSWSRMPSM